MTRWRRRFGGWQWLATIGLLVSLAGATIVPDVPVLGQAAAGATLSVLAAPVEVASRGGAFVAARDGMTLGPGDQVRTMGGGVALLTFFDGSEIQLAPDSQVQIQQTNTSSSGPQINVAQIAGTTIDRVQRIASQPTSFSTNTPAATAIVRGTRYVITVKCYATPPVLPPTRLLTFPRRLSGTPYLLADEVLYDDVGTLWMARAWQDATTGESFSTYDEVGSTYPQIAETLYQEKDGSFWLAREWQDPDSGATWSTYEDVGVPVDDQQTASLPVTRVTRRLVPVGQSQVGCHPVTSVVVVEGRVGLQPTNSTLPGFDITPGLAGAASDVASASSPLSRQGLLAFDQATSNLRDPNGARTAGQLGSQVADEFAAIILPPPPGPGGPGGAGGTGGPAGPGGLGSTASGLLGGVTVRGATVDSGLVGQVVPFPPEVAGVQTGPPPAGGAAPTTSPAPPRSNRQGEVPL